MVCTCEAPCVQNLPTVRLTNKNHGALPVSESAFSSMDGNENDSRMYEVDLVNLAPSPLIFTSIGECNVLPFSSYNLKWKVENN